MTLSSPTLSSPAVEPAHMQNSSQVQDISNSPPAALPRTPRFGRQLRQLGLRIASRLTASGVAQRRISSVVRILQHLQGIGSASHVDSSGERAALKQCQIAVATCIFDVGANQGEFLDEVCGQRLAPSVQIHAFEPGDTTFKILRSRISDTRVVLNNIALGSVCGTATLHYDRAGSGLASLSARRLDHFGICFSKNEPVQVETLDVYCQRHAIKHIDILKIDVEGNELDVLKGAQELLQQGSIKHIIFEGGGCQIDTRLFFQDFFYFFQRYNMDLFRVTAGGYLTPLLAYSEELEVFRTTMYVAQRRT